MPVLLTKCENEIYEKAREFGLAYLAPNAAQWEEQRTLPPEAIDEVRKGGFFGVGCPESVGGKGYTYLETALTYEGLAYGDAGFAFFVQLHNNIVFEIATFYETSNTVKALVPDLVSGVKLSAFALTDDDGGSDPHATGAYAEEKEDGYHLHGKKSWVSNSINADYFTTIVKDGSPKGMVMLLVPRDTSGFTVQEDIRRAGGNVMSCGRIQFEDAVVPKAYLLSTHGFREALRAIDVARIFVPAIAVGMAQRCIDATAAYLAQRHTFGKPILQNQAIQFQLAELSAEVEAARWLCYHTASLQDSVENATVCCAKNKLFGPDAAQRVANQCAQLMGAAGFEWNSEITRCVNMARTMKIMDGSSEVQKMIISRAIEKAAEGK